MRFIAEKGIKRIMNEVNSSRCSQSSPQTLAGRAVLLEIGARSGLLDPLLSQKEVFVTEVADHSGVEESFVSGYYAALVHAGLAELLRKSSNGPSYYSSSPELHDSINEVSYMVWGLVSCAPLISNPVAFSKNLTSAAETYVRNGEHVARTSKWMGERDWYPHAEAAILSCSPKKIVDLGSGTCGLLIRCLRKLPNAYGVGIDVNKDACIKAQSIIKDAGLAKRLSVLEAPIENLVQNPAPLIGADVVHAGFVFHDLMPDEEQTLDALLSTIRENTPRGMLVVVDAVPYAQNPEERAFSAAFTFLHKHFMGLKFLTEEGWKEKLGAAGYGQIDVGRLGASGGRIFSAKSC